MARSILAAVLGISLRGALAASRGAARAASFVEGLVLAALSDDELQRLTDSCYRREGRSEQEAFAWERAWFERDLPMPPASLLVGGAGRGRELRYLRERGYSVVAFDPVAGTDSGVYRLSYQQLAEPGPSRADLDAVLAGAPYDAILFGWGSVSHVPGADTRAALLRAARRLSDGPLLMSFLIEPPGVPSRRGRWFDWGRRIGGALGDDRGSGRTGDRVTGHGYFHRFTHSEIEALARGAGYVAACHDDGYPHATLTPVAGA